MRLLGAVMRGTMGYNADELCANCHRKFHVKERV